jgi:beta-phosphoglucomutase-like phosphatase (HAD superfamily)
MSEEATDQETATTSKRACGLIVDFDYALIDGISALEKACAKALDAAGVKADKGTFPRHLFGHKVNAALRALLGAEGKTESAIASIASDMDHAAEKAPVDEAILAVCKRTLEANAHVVFVTMRTQSVVEARVETLGLEGAVVLKCERCDRFGDYPADIWSRAARTIKLNPRFCTAIVASATSVRHAVVAGMRTAAFTNPMISFQDFSGVDFSAGSVPSADTVDAVMALINSRA